MITAEQQELIRQWLGYPADQQSTQIISDRCAQSVAAVPALSVTLQGWLRELDRIDKEMKASRPFQSRTFQSNAGGTIQRSPAMQIGHSQGEARRIISDISATFQIPIRRDVFEPMPDSRGAGRIMRA